MVLFLGCAWQSGFLDSFIDDITASLGQNSTLGAAVAKGAMAIDAAQAQLEAQYESEAGAEAEQTDPTAIWRIAAYASGSF